MQGDEPIFAIESVGDILILQMVPDPTVSNYVSRQHEYNRLYKQVGDTAGTHVLFDLTGCFMLDSVTIGIMVSLTNRCRQDDGDSILVGISTDIHEMLGRLMLLQPDKKRAMWQTFEDRSAGIAVLNANNN